MESLKINGKSYPARELDFNFICDLAENGIGIDELAKKIIPAVRVYAAFCMGTTTDIAGEELNQHVINGGKLNDLVDMFSKKAESSDFFQALGKNTEEQESSPKRTPKKKNEEVSE